MGGLQAFLAWLYAGSNLFVLAAAIPTFVFILLLLYVLFKIIVKLDLRQMFSDEQGSISSTKFWNIIGFFVATVMFLYVNFTTPGAAGLEFIWLIYMGTVAGSAGLSKLIAARYGSRGYDYQEKSNYEQPYDPDRRSTGRRKSRSRALVPIQGTREPIDQDVSN